MPLFIDTARAGNHNSVNYFKKDYNNTYLKVNAEVILFIITIKQIGLCLYMGH